MKVKWVVNIAVVCVHRMLFYTDILVRAQSSYYLSLDIFITTTHVGLFTLKPKASLLVSSHGTIQSALINIIVSGIGLESAGQENANWDGLLVFLVFIYHEFEPDYPDQVFSVRDLHTKFGGRDITRKVGGNKCATLCMVNRLYHINHYTSSKYVNSLPAPT